MKSLLLSFFLLLFFLFTACQPKELSLKGASIIGQWQLSHLIHGWTGQMIKADTLPYQEYYQFSSNGSFKKYNSNGIYTKGSYSVLEKTNGDYEIELTFVQETDEEKKFLQFSCSGKLILELSKSEGLIENNLACDGPKNYYRNVKQNE